MHNIAILCILNELSPLNLLSASNILYPLNPQRITSWWLYVILKWDDRWLTSTDLCETWKLVSASHAAHGLFTEHLMHIAAKNAKHFFDLASSNLIGCLCAVLLVGCKGFLNQSNGKQSHLPKFVKSVPIKDS